MTTIKANCPMCGEVSLGAHEILLRMAYGEASGTYGFSCPRCGGFVEKAADERIVRLLLSGGVIPLAANIPAEALESRDGVPFTYDDVLAFHELLENDNWFDQLIGQLDT